ncbi:MAG TPA: hypothetical protein VIY51_01340 [Xanthobacteraceae bacterium]
MPLKAPAAAPLPPWQFTLDEDTRFYSWTGSRGFPAAGGAVAPGGSGSQLYVPVSLGAIGQTSPEHKWEFQIRSGYVWSQQTTLGQAGLFSNLTDTGVTATHTYLGINGIQPYASVALNLPTGRSALLGTAANGRMDPDLVGIAVSGEGVNVGPTLGANIPVGESWMFGIAAGYTYRGPYSKDALVNPATLTPFLGPTSTFDPGDDITLTGTLTYVQGALSWRVSADAAFESNTNVNGVLGATPFSGALMRAGDRYTVQSTASYDWTKYWTSVLAGAWSHSNSNHVLAANLPPLITELFNSNNDVFQVTLDNKFQVTPDVIAGPTGGYMYRNHNSWIVTNALFVPEKTKWTAGGFFTYNLLKDFALNGRVEHYWVNQNVTPATLVPVVTDNGWLISLGGTHTW